MPNVTIYHNPACTKSRQTLALLRDRDIEPVIVEYLSHPPSAEQLRKILTLLKLKPRDLIRQKEPLYKELQLENVHRDEVLIQIMIRHPILIERPIVIHGNKAVIGRPPENVLEII